MPDPARSSPQAALRRPKEPRRARRRPASVPRQDSANTHVQTAFLDSECFKRGCDVVRRTHPNRPETALASPPDVFVEIVEEYKALRRHADGPHDVIIGFRIGLSKPDDGGQEDLAEMAEHFRELF